MPRRGFGFSVGRIRPQNILAESIGNLGGLRLAPGTDWNGTAGSGFAVAPVDPARTTAKPVMRLLTPDYQWFNDTLTIGVQAWANDGETLIGGIDRVRFWFEGNSVDVLEPTFQRKTRYDGSTYDCLGYWVNLQKPAGVSGNGHVYIEAIPADATMQKRVLGPIPYSAVTTLHDFDLAVDNNAAVVAGASYQTVTDALEYLKAQSAQNPRVTIKATDTTAFHTMSLVPASNDYAGGTGRCLIEAEAPVTFGFPTYVSDNANGFRPRYGGLHIRGPNITFDAQRLLRITQEQLTTSNGIWLDRVKVTADAASPYWRSGLRPSPMFVETGTVSWFTECFAEVINDPYTGATLARGCVGEHGYNDFSQGSFCVVNCIARDWDSLDPWQTFVDAITITGPAQATLSLVGGNEATTRTFTARVNGVSVGTFVIGSTEARYNTAIAPGYNPATAGQGYFISDVAGWINSLSGWSATVIDNERRASAFSDYRGGIGQDKGRAFSNVPVDTATTFQTYFDVHTDVFKQTPANVENILWAFNSATNVRGQSFFVTEAPGAQDWAIINNAVSNVEGEGNLIQFAMRAPGGGLFSHFVFAHNSVPRQAALLRSSDPDFAPDSYCLFANNVLADLGWSANGPRGSATIKDNVLDEGHPVPATSTGTVIAGTPATKLPGSLAGDFTPAGELLTNLKPPVVAIDASGRTRTNNSTVGSVGAIF